MRILAVDDEPLALDNLTALLREVVPDADITGFIKPLEAFAWLETHPADVAFLDIKMGKMNGITLAKKCKDIRPDINIIFVTGYDQYAMDALQLRASGYLIKPVRALKLRTELENLRNPLPNPNRCRVRVQAFGSFEIFVDGKPLPLRRAKCKECLAYLIDRKGARVTTAELASVLWENEDYSRRIQNNTYRVIAETVKALKHAGAGDILVKTRRDVAAVASMIDCDYYRFLSGDVSQINAFHGEYMSNYSWAEFTLGELMDTNKKR